MNFQTFAIEVDLNYNKLRIMNQPMLKGKSPSSLREVLAQWEKSATLAPLTQAQQDAVIDFASHADDRPFPDLVGLMEFAYR